MGGQAHDVTDAIEAGGIVPEEVYPGIIKGEEGHNHSELDAMMKAFCNVIIKKKTGKVSEVWEDACNALLDVYLGEIPESFTYEGVEYTPESFAKKLDIDTNDYIELTSYSNYPFYEPVLLEVPDNWSNDLYYNIPLEELIDVMNFALENGYTFVWDGHVSGRDFSFEDGLAIIPEKDWSEKNEEEKNNTFKVPEPEKNIDQEFRQRSFDNQTVNDQHLMHVTGLFTDQNGTRYYNTKNSWGEERNDFGGYLKMSEPYMRLKTIAIMINKNALPDKLKRKLGIRGSR
jgi:bleomycin hydrolase